MPLQVLFIILKNLKKNKNIKSIIHVGSSKNKITKNNCKVNDIDLFIIVENQNIDQIRKIETIWSYLKLLLLYFWMLGDYNIAWFVNLF